jgi:hypothetical protein
MVGFRETKTELRTIFLTGNWPTILEQRTKNAEQAAKIVNPLLALLIRPETRWQAVHGLGLAVSRLAGGNMEAARVILRRLMWSLNEESGNLGWGAPEAIGAILAASSPLAGEFARILISYGYETGKDDNFLEHAPLRRGVYWGIGRLAQSNPAAAAPALPHLAAALEDDYWPIRGMAAWALTQMARHADGPLADRKEKLTTLAAVEKARRQAGQDPAARTQMDLLDLPGLPDLAAGASILQSSPGALLDEALAALS